MTILSILITYHQAFWQGLLVTLQLCAVIWSVGLVLGTLLGVAATRDRALGQGLRWLSFALAGIPVIVLLFWLHYPAQAAFNIVIDPFYTAMVTFAFVNIVGVSDLVRHAADELPGQYLIAAKVSGLTRRQTFRNIELPLLFRGAFPGVLMLQVSMLHVTLFSSLISVEEIFRVAQRINASIYKPVEIYTALAVFFLLVCVPINLIALRLKQKYMRSLGER
mgnify:CR=1 FL=1